MEADLVIIGAGSGGYEAALYARRRGMKVILVELSPETVGGNCLNKGCIPSKFMRHGAYLIDKLSKMKQWGIFPTGYTFNFSHLKSERDKVIFTIRENFKKFAKTVNIPIVYGKGIVKDPHTVYVEGAGLTIKTRFILLATGSKPISVGKLLPDGRRILDTDQIWNIEKIPSRILIVGGGAVGVEFAYIFKNYGCKVTLVELRRRILPTDDIPEDSARYLGRKLRQIGVDIRTKTTVESYEEIPQGLQVKLTDGSELIVDLILLAIGRRPNTEGIGLEDAGVEKDERGFVKVDSYSRTTVPGVYACGDITSPLMLAHKAMYEGKVAVSHMLGENEWQRDPMIIPKIVYSALEVASVGLTEDQAEEEGYDVKVGVSSFVFNPKAMDDGENEGFVRIVVDEKSGKILGAHIVGPHAGELIHQVIHMIKGNLDIDMAVRSMYAHPSLSEAVGQSLSEIKYGSLTWTKR